MTYDPQSRKWQITINNPQKKNMTHDAIRLLLESLTSIIYYCMSDEIASTHHTHVYILSKTPIRFSTLKHRFSDAHLEKAYGTSVQNRDYVFKEGKWVNDKKKETNLSDTHEEWGEIPPERQGARNDYAELYEMLMEGKSNYEILEENPDFIGQIERMDRVRKVIQEETYKEVFRTLETTYIFGDTNTGKTRSIMEKYGYANVYRVTNYKNPFDQYNGQDVIMFEEFRSSLPISDILKYLEGYPLTLPSRYADKIACYTKVYIVTNIDLFAQYREIQEHEPKTWKAFLRRIHTVQTFLDDKIETYTMFDYLYSFHKLSAEQMKLVPFSKEDKKR